jgi:hypothetical protein
MKAPLSTSFQQDTVCIPEGGPASGPVSLLHLYLDFSQFSQVVFAQQIVMAISLYLRALAENPERRILYVLICNDKTTLREYS